MNLSAGEIAILIPITSLAVVQIINAVKASTRHDQVDTKLAQITTQTNGNTDKLQAALTESLIRIGKLEGLITGLQTQRGGGRVSDPASVIVPASVVPAGPGSSGTPAAP